MSEQRAPQIKKRAVFANLHGELQVLESESVQENLNEQHGAE